MSTHKDNLKDTPVEQPVTLRSSLTMTAGQDAINGLGGRAPVEAGAVFVASFYVYMYVCMYVITYFY